MVGSLNFAGGLGELFAQALAANGFEVEQKFKLGNARSSSPLSRRATSTSSPNTRRPPSSRHQGRAATRPATRPRRREADGSARPAELTALDFAQATDQNGFVVTKATADKYAFAKTSDLANPAP